ncbi:MAG TPA: MaoC family dehydratase [Blastocatellia bacterium]|nr:MaoC family dehydratase [Blastocatellia bacterium]
MPPREIEDYNQLRELVGQEIAVTDWFPITQERINRFAEATEDRQWIHLDVERAGKESPYGTTIAHGFLTLSMLSHLMTQALNVHQKPKMSINYGLNRVRFTSAVPAGSRVRARVTLKAYEEIAGGGQITWDVVVEREGSDKPCCVAEWLGRYYL